MDKEILLQLQQLHKDIQQLRCDIVPRLEKLENHIDFVETTYDGLRKPLDFVKSYFYNSQPRIENPVTDSSPTPAP
jgi:hypothetical protein